jgi:hypothetical protein
MGTPPDRVPRNWPTAINVVIQPIAAGDAGMKSIRHTPPAGDFSEGTPINRKLKTVQQRIDKAKGIAKETEDAGAARYRAAHRLED